MEKYFSQRFISRYNKIKDHKLNLHSGNKYHNNDYLE